jgi:hypothetical protein
MTQAPRRVGRPRAPEESFTLYVRVGAALHRRLERIALSRPGLSLSTVARHFLAKGINSTADERPAERAARPEYAAPSRSRLMSTRPAFDPALHFEALLRKLGYPRTFNGQLRFATYSVGGESEWAPKLDRLRQLAGSERRDMALNLMNQLDTSSSVMDAAISAVLDEIAEASRRPHPAT